MGLENIDVNETIKKLSWKRWNHKTIVISLLNSVY